MDSFDAYGYRKVNKVVARRMYNEGVQIYLLPCQVNAYIMFDPLYKYVWIQTATISKDSGVTFDTAVNTFEYFNCNSELGRYAHYYIKTEQGGKDNEVEAKGKRS